jgi:hypothetical protein
MSDETLSRIHTFMSRLDGQHQVYLRAHADQRGKMAA